jgi:hypothetical protein
MLRKRPTKYRAQHAIVKPRACRWQFAVSFMRLKSG